MRSRKTPTPLNSPACVREFSLVFALTNSLRQSPSRHESPNVIKATSRQLTDKNKQACFCERTLARQACFTFRLSLLVKPLAFLARQPAFAY
jgi:hypothetical protein